MDTSFTPSYLGTKLSTDVASETTQKLVKLNTDKLDIPLSQVSVSIAAAAGLTNVQLRASPVPVSGTFWQATQPVSGTFWQATQPVSGTVTANAGSGTFAVSAASLPLPTGASTAAKQPALGVAGTASTDVLSVQGVASMTALKVDGSGVTQPVSGTVTSTIANLDVALSTRTKPADQQHAIIDSGTVTTVSTVTNVSQQGGVAISLNTGVRDTGTQRVTIATNDVVPSSQSGTWTVQPGNTANTTAWKVDGSAATQPVSGTFWQGTQPVSIATAPVLVAGSAIIGKVGIDQTTPGTTNAVQVVGGSADAGNALLAIANKPTSSSAYAPSLFQNLGANATLNVKASTGNVFSITCYNANAASRYIQLHNTATVPAGGAVPVFSFLIPSISQIIIGTDFFTDGGTNFSTGIAFAFSTTRDTYTAGVNTDQSTCVEYK